MRKLVALREPVVEHDADIAGSSGVEDKIADSFPYAGMNDKRERVWQEFEFLSTTVPNETGGIVESEPVVLVVGPDDEPTHQLVAHCSDDLRQRHGDVVEGLAGEREIANAKLVSAIGFNLKFAAVDAMNVRLIASRS